MGKLQDCPMSTAERQFAPFRGLEQGIFVPFGHQNAPRADVERWAAAGAKLGVLHKKIRRKFSYL